MDTLTLSSFFNLMTLFKQIKFLLKVEHSLVSN